MNTSNAVRQLDKVSRILNSLDRGPVLVCYAPVEGSVYEINYYYGSGKFVLKRDDVSTILVEVDDIEVLSPLEALGAVWLDEN